MPKISVIVPVYKAEKYIRRCVDSILAQTFTDFELLLVDDGSPDNSGAICDEYAARDSRVKVFHKENGGVSSARQMGLDNSLGEYVIHADPDDWVEPDMLQELYSEAQQSGADMVICDFYINYGNRQIYKSQKPEKLSHDAILKELLMQRLHGACWNKLVRRDLFEKYEVKFPEDIIRWEDLFVNVMLLINSVRVSYKENAYYHYDCGINQNSIVRKPSRLGIDSQIRFCERVETKLMQNDLNKDILFMSKAVTKELMVNSNICSYDEIESVFSEINDRYTKKWGNVFLIRHLSDLFKYSVSCAIKKHKLRSIVALKIYNYTVRIIKCLK